MVFFPTLVSRGGGGFGCCCLSREQTTAETRRARGDEANSLSRPAGVRLCCALSPRASPCNKSPTKSQHTGVCVCAGNCSFSSCVHACVRTCVISDGRQNNNPHTPPNKNRPAGREVQTTWQRVCLMAHDRSISIFWARDRLLLRVCVRVRACVCVCLCVSVCVCARDRHGGLPLVAQ